MDILHNEPLFEAPQTELLHAFDTHYNNPDWGHWPGILQKIRLLGESQARIDITLQAQVLEGLWEHSQVAGVHPEWLKHSLYLRSLLERFFWV